MKKKLTTILALAAIAGFLFAPQSQAAVKISQQVQWVPTFLGGPVSPSVRLLEWVQDFGFKPTLDLPGGSLYPATPNQQFDGKFSVYAVFDVLDGTFTDQIAYLVL